MDEFNLIRKIVEEFPRASGQVNRVFESDAEIIRLGNRTLAVTIDEYSEEEDYFSSADPRILGWNLVIATMSDLLAVGATPEYFLQVIGVPEVSPETFCRELAKGVGEGLAANGAFLIGGDLSGGKTWRYVGNAIGTIEGNPILRKTERDSLLLYVTGKLGCGNLSALNRKYQAKFESRKTLMERVGGEVFLAMDTSDGLRNTLLTLSMVNPQHTFLIDSDQVPVHQDAATFGKFTKVPPEGFLFGSAGEYELVLGIDPTNKIRFEKAVQREATLIGSMERGRKLQPGLYWNRKEFKKPKPDIPLTIDPRENPDREAYIKEILKTVKTLFYSDPSAGS